MLLKLLQSRMRKLLAHRWTWIVLVTAGVIGGVAWLYHLYQVERANRIVAETLAVTQRRLLNNTEIRLASAEANMAELRESYDAMKVLQGQILAAVKVRISARDTLIRHDTLPTGTLPDSTRVAHFRDSSFAGTITGTITAPPCCAPLGVQYAVHRPAFAPEVAFIRLKNDSVLAAVSWQGERFEITAPFFRPLPRTAPRLAPFVQGTYSTVPGLRVAEGGLVGRPGRDWQVEVGVQHQLTREPETGVFARLRKEFRLR
jgi:hypothetical protein